MRKMDENGSDSPYDVTLELGWLICNTMTLPDMTKMGSVHWVVWNHEIKKQKMFLLISTNSNCFGNMVNSNKHGQGHFPFQAKKRWNGVTIGSPCCDCLGLLPEGGWDDCCNPIHVMDTWADPIAPQRWAWSRVVLLVLLCLLGIIWGL